MSVGVTPDQKQTNEARSVKITANKKGFFLYSYKIERPPSPTPLSVESPPFRARDDAK
jgi:hypothetical protein